MKGSEIKETMNSFKFGFENPRVHDGTRVLGDCHF